MSSSIIDEGELFGYDYEISSKRTFFSGSKRRRPPESETDEVMQVPVNVGNKTPLACVREGNSPTFDSAADVVFTPEVCGESDLTTENLMAEESSKSYTNDESRFESAAESLSKGPGRVSGSNTNSRVLHSFMEEQEFPRESRISTLGTSAAAHQSTYARSFDQKTRPSTSTPEDSVSDSRDVSKLERTSLSPVNFISISASQSAAPSENVDWLKLSVGSGHSGNTSFRETSGRADEVLDRSPSIIEGRSYGKRKAPVLDFDISESDKLNPSIPLLCQGSVSKRVELDTGSTSQPRLLHIPAIGVIPRAPSPRTANSNVKPPDHNLELIPGRPATSFPYTSGGQQTFINRGDAGRENSAPVSGRNFQPFSGLPSGTASLPHTNADEFTNYVAAENPPLPGVGRPTSYRYLPSIMLKPGDEGQFRQPFTTRDTLLPTLSVGSMHGGDRRQTPGNSWWLSSEPARQLITPPANSPSWSSNLAASSQAGAHRDQDTVRHFRQQDYSLQGSPSDWERLSRRVGPSMMFPSHVQISEGFNRILPVKNEAVTIPTEGKDGQGFEQVAVKVEPQSYPEWTRMEPLNLGSVATWFLQGEKTFHKPSAERVESPAGEGSSTIAVQPGKISDVEQMLGSRQISHQRQSWQSLAVAGQQRQQQPEDLHIVGTSRTAAPDSAKPWTQVLPPVSASTSSSELWFVLQSAEENQSDEGRLPQISKAYLRVKDGQIPVSVVKKYLATKLGLANVEEVEITCKGQPIGPNLPLQQVRDFIWDTKSHASKQQTPGSGDRDVSLSGEVGERPTTAYKNPAAKDALMILTYRRSSGPGN